MAPCPGETFKNEEEEEEEYLIFLCLYCAFFSVSFLLRHRGQASGLKLRIGLRIVTLVSIAIVPFFLLSCNEMSTVASSCFGILRCNMVVFYF